MVRRTTRTSTASGGGLTRLLARRGFGKPAAWVGGVALCYALITSTVPVSAQIQSICSSPNCTASNQVLIGGTAITSSNSMTLSGTLDGGGGQGFFVAQGGTLT